MKSTLTLIVASAASLITFLVTRRIFQEQLKLGPPGKTHAASQTRPRRRANKVSHRPTEA
jgi:hypothetical protein